MNMILKQVRYKKISTSRDRDQVVILFSGFLVVAKIVVQRSGQIRLPEARQNARQPPEGRNTQTQFRYRRA